MIATGINHIDIAASYGDSELRLGRGWRATASDFFLATKTGKRTYAESRATRSGARWSGCGVDQIDLIQLHNLAEPDGVGDRHGAGRRAARRRSRRVTRGWCASSG